MFSLLPLSNLLSMKKNFVGPVVTIIILVLLVAGFFYFHFTLKRLNNRMNELQTTIANDSAQLNSVVNFFNASLNPQQ